MTNQGAPRIQTEVQVMFFDTDCAAVVHNIAYLRFIEVARTLLAEKLGMKLNEMAATQRYPVVVRTEIDYRRTAALGDRLRIEGWLDRCERVRFWCAFEIRRLGDEALIAEASKNPQIAAAFSSFRASVPQLYANVDRVKAKKENVAVTNIFQALQVNLGSFYINDFNYLGRTYKVIAHADAPCRAKSSDVAQLKTRNDSGKMVPL